MQIEKTTPLFCVSLEQGEAGHISQFSLQQLVNSVKGGTKLEDMAIFTDLKEAETNASLVSMLAVCNMNLRSLSPNQLEQARKAIEAIRES